MKKDEKSQSVNNSIKNKKNTIQNKQYSEENNKNIDESIIKNVILFQQVLQNDINLLKEDNLKINDIKISQKTIESQENQNIIDTKNFCNCILNNHNKATFEVMLEPFGKFTVKTISKNQNLSFLINSESEYTKNFIKNHNKNICNNLSKDLDKEVNVFIEV